MDDRDALADYVTNMKKKRLAPLMALANNIDEQSLSREARQVVEDIQLQSKERDQMVYEVASRVDHLARNMQGSRA